MMEIVQNLVQFLAQAIIILTCVIIVIAFIASVVAKNKESADLKAKNLNKKFNKNRFAVLKTILDKKDIKKSLKEQKKADSSKEKQPNLFVLSFDGDIKASAVEQLRQEISAVLMVAQKDDRVLLKLESPGGMVHGYGLAASQLQRITDKGIHLTICIDKIAASGGYMMACLANEVIAAPFAIIGSIGVVASLPNFNKVLKKYDVDYLEITAGEYKRTLTPLGEITDSKMAKFKEQIEEIHVLFKDHVAKQRPQMNIAKVATGEYWYGLQALDLKLVDRLSTSDDVLLEAAEKYQLTEITFEGKKSFAQKLSENMQIQLESASTKVADLIWRKRFQ